MVDRYSTATEEFVMFGLLSVLGSVPECGACIVIDLYLLGTVHTESFSVIRGLYQTLKFSVAPPSEARVSDPDKILGRTVGYRCDDGRSSRGRSHPGERTGWCGAGAMPMEVARRDCERTRLS